MKKDKKYEPSDADKKTLIEMMAEIGRQLETGARQINIEGEELANGQVKVSVRASRISIEEAESHVTYEKKEIRQIIKVNGKRSMARITYGRDFINGTGDIEIDVAEHKDDGNFTAEEKEELVKYVHEVVVPRYTGHDMKHVPLTRVCPACKMPKMEMEDARNALSRYYEHTYICSQCGLREALEGNFWHKN